MVIICLFQIYIKPTQRHHGSGGKSPRDPEPDPLLDGEAVPDPVLPAGPALLLPVPGKALERLEDWRRSIPANITVNITENITSIF